MQEEARALNLNELDLEKVASHGGKGEILFHRVFPGAAFQGPVNFVDYAVLPPGTSIGIHTHGKDEEIYLVLEGEGVMHLDGKEFPVRPGHVILNGPGGTHGLENTGDEVLKLYVIEVRLGKDKDHA
jgi:mannose-6-phosphate isomerase-like protein (cupin superfamily)